MWQEILAVDSLYTPHRSSIMATSQPESSLYLKRRLQLLSSSPNKIVKKDPTIRKRYISLRVKLLKRQFGLPANNDLLSLRNLSLSETPPSSSTNLASSSSITSGDGKIEGLTAASSSSTSAVKFRSVHQIYDYHRDEVTRIKFGRRVLISSSLDGTVAVVKELDNLKGIPVILDGHGRSGVLSCDISETNEFIVSSGLDGSTILWDTFSGRQLRKVNENRGNYVWAVRFLPRNNNFILCVLNSGSVQIMNISTGKYVSSSPLVGTPVSLEINQNGSLLWIGNESGIVESFKLDPNLGKIVKGSRIHLNNSTRITSLSAGRSSKFPSSPLDPPCLLVTHAQGGATINLYRIVDDNGALVPYKSLSTAGGESIIKSTSFAPKSNSVIATGNEDGSLALLDLTTNTFNNSTKEQQNCINKLHGHLKPVIKLGFSSDEAYLVTADSSGQIIIWKK